MTTVVSWRPMVLREENNPDKTAPSRTALSHATIIWGSGDAERAACAEQLAAAMVCVGPGARPCMECSHCIKASRRVHPDILMVDRQGDAREIHVDQIRAVRDNAVIMPNEAETKVYVIFHADTMNSSAQNALIKILEEPPASARFILVAENQALLLPTVRSRCVAVAAPRTDLAPVSSSEIVSAFFAALEEGPIKLTELSFELEKLEKNAFIDFLGGARALAVLRLRESLTAGSVLPPEYLLRTVRILDRAGEYFRKNVGLGHISGMICAALIIRNEENND